MKPGWKPVHWPSDNPHQTPSPYYRSSNMRNGNIPSLPQLSCSNSDSSLSDSPSSVPTSPHGPPTLARSRVVHPDSSSNTEQKQGTAPEEMEGAMKVVLRYAEVDSALRRAPSGNAQGTHGSRPGETLSLQDSNHSAYPHSRSRGVRGEDREDTDYNRDGHGGLALEDLIHQDDSPVHRPGSLQDILTNDCDPILGSTPSRRVIPRQGSSDQRFSSRIVDLLTSNTD